MGTTVPINQYVETIYVNTMGAFSTETVRAVIENANLDFKDIGGSTVYYLAANLTDGMALIIFKSNTNDYAILWGNFSQGQWLYSSKADLTPDNFVGWNKSFEGIINFVGNNVGNEDTILGTQNELLKGLFSITPFEKRVNRVFLNTNMTVDEVKTTAAQLIIGSDVAYAVFFNEPKGIVVLLQEGEVMIIYSNDEQEEKCIFSSASNEVTNFGFEGWDPEFNGVITFKTELFEGCQNDVVKNLINTYPFDLSLGKVFSNIANGIRTKLGKNEEKWNGDSGTPVPVGENVEKVYFNYEYDPILISNVFKKLTFTTNINLSSDPFYVVYANATLTRVIVIFDKGYTLGQKSYLLSIMDFTGASGLPNYDIYRYPAFEDDLKDVGYIELNEVGISESLGVTAGVQNELLKDIISITPFVKRPTYVIEPYNMSYEIDDIKDSAKVVTKVIKGDKIPNDGTELNGIYFNIALSIEEVVNKLENLTFSMEDTLGLIEFVLYATDSSGEGRVMLAAGYEDGAWFILEMLTQFPYFVSKDVNGDYGFEGWNPDLNSTNGAFIGNVTLTTKPSLTMEGITIPVGNQNEYLSDLIAFTPFEERETYTELSGEYDGSTIQVTENQEVDVLELAKESKLPAKIEVNVLIPEDYIKPSGELEITENAVYNIREYETVNVNVASSGSTLKALLDTCQSMRNFPSFIEVTSFDDVISYNDTENVTSFFGSFTQCTKLLRLPLMNTERVTNCNSFCYFCESLEFVPALNFSNVTGFNSAFYGCSKLKTFLAYGMKVSFSISYSTKFEQSDLVTILNNLATVTSTQTLTMGATNLAKLTDEDKAIATNKGWTLA